MCVCVSHAALGLVDPHQRGHRCRGMGVRALLYREPAQEAFWRQGIGTAHGHGETPSVGAHVSKPAMQHKCSTGIEQGACVLARQWVHT